MRNITLVSALSALSLAACGPGDPDATDRKTRHAAQTVAEVDMPAGPTPGLWRITTRINGLAGGMETPSVETCIREAKFEPPQGAAPESPGMTCEQQSFRREGDAMVGHMACTAADGVRTVTDTRITGDYAHSYRMEVKSTTTPAPTPSMAQVTMVMAAERLGDCPADRQAQ